MEQLLETIRAFDGVLDLAPVAGGDHPEIAWGDHFFYYAPDGVIPARVQPYATVVTKDYPGDTRSDLDPPGRWRVNIHVGGIAFTELLGVDPRQSTDGWDFAASDVLLPHPIYARQGWVAAVVPGDRTLSTVIALLRSAHQQARQRFIDHPPSATPPSPRR